MSAEENGTLVLATSLDKEIDIKVGKGLPPLREILEKCFVVVTPVGSDTPVVFEKYSDLVNEGVVNLPPGKYSGGLVQLYLSGLPSFDNPIYEALFGTFEINASEKTMVNAALQLTQVKVTVNFDERLEVKYPDIRVSVYDPDPALDSSLAEQLLEWTPENDGIEGYFVIEGREPEPDNEQEDLKVVITASEVNGQDSTKTVVKIFRDVRPNQHYNITVVDGEGELEIEPFVLDESLIEVDLPFQQLPVVYIAGSWKDESGAIIAGYWADGQPITLQDNAVAKDIHVEDGVVHVVGDVYKGGLSSGVYWKNGVANQFPGENTFNFDLSVFKRSLQVFNGIAYNVGANPINQSSYIPTLFRENIPARPLSGADVFGEALDLYYVDGVAHIVGFEWISEGGFPRLNGKLWQVGFGGNPNVEENLTDERLNAVPYAVKVVDGDVYIAGYTSNYSTSGSGNRRAVYWKNGELIRIEHGQENTEARAIEVVNGDVHVIGVEYREEQIHPAFAKLKYWVNGSEMNLEHNSDYPSEANDVRSINGDIYIVGHSNNNTATVWKNGAPSYLYGPNGTGFQANAIYIGGN